MIVPSRPNSIIAYDRPMDSSFSIASFDLLELNMMPPPHKYSDTQQARGLGSALSRKLQGKYLRKVKYVAFRTHNFGSALEHCYSPRAGNIPTEFWADLKRQRLKENAPLPKARHSE